MTKRLISLALVVVMLLGILVSTASCALYQSLEEFVGAENLGQDYFDKYYPDANDDTADTNNGNNKHDSKVQREDGCNLITFFWSNKLWTRDPAKLAMCDIWCWWDGADGKGYLMTPCEYGAMLTLNIPKEVTEVGFIVRTGCTDPGGTSWGIANKDCGPDDLFATIEGDDTFIYLVGGQNDANQYHSNDGGKTLEVIEKFNIAGMADLNVIDYWLTPKTDLTVDQVKVFDGDKEIPVLKLTNQTKTKRGKITIDGEFDITKTYTLVIEGFGEHTIVPTTIFDTQWFAENYHYDGDDLGAVINGSNTTFKVWAPTASKVVLNLFKSGHEGEAYKQVEMIRGDKGVWSFTEACGHGTYYTYSVTTVVGTQEAVDPYAKSAGLNGNRGMVIDLDSTDPTGWEADQDFYVKDTDGTPIDSYSDAVIWEIHVRDFSNMITSSNYKGKYLAFTENGLVNEHGVSVGVDYLKELGVNFVHILPMYDYATVKEEDPNSGFNWGYDPKNYNVPEGSYSTDPYHGEVRVNELKQMVMALHEAGIGVVMDVVYNHTYDKNASFNRIVPYYYYRYKQNGANSSGSGCGNDTASERFMYGKFMVDSTTYWMEEYNLDGFRFDLMGLHDTKTMQDVESAVHSINPQALLYGEGWTMMQNSYKPSLSAATQGNINKVVATNGGIGAIAVFNDIIRTGLKGESDDGTKAYINGDPSDYHRNRVLFGIHGGDMGGVASWRTPTYMVVNYMSAHDNSTLWDKLCVSLPGTSSSVVNQRLAQNRLGATILFASRGMVFFQAGEEMLRTKPNSKYDTGYDHNSYKSSDEINNLKWNTLKPGSNEYDMFRYYAGLAAIRTQIDIFSNAPVFKTYAHTNNSGLSIKMEDNKGGKAYVIVNPSNNAIKYTLDGTYSLICNGTTAGVTSLGTCSGEITIPAGCAYILVTSNLLP